jgi:hypothetical protein
VQINETLVNLELITIPGLGTLTARLEKTGKVIDNSNAQVLYVTYCLAGGDLEDLGRKTNGALHAQLLILSAVDEVI